MNSLPSSSVKPGSGLEAQGPNEQLLSFLTIFGPQIDAAEGGELPTGTFTLASGEEIPDAADFVLAKVRRVRELAATEDGLIATDAPDDEFRRILSDLDELDLLCEAVSQGAGEPGGMP